MIHQITGQQRAMAGQRGLRPVPQVSLPDKLKGHGKTAESSERVGVATWPVDLGIHGPFSPGDQDDRIDALTLLSVKNN